MYKLTERKGHGVKARDLHVVHEKEAKNAEINECECTRVIITVKRGCGCQSYKKLASISIGTSICHG